MIQSGQDYFDAAAEIWFMSMCKKKFLLSSFVNWKQEKNSIIYFPNVASLLIFTSEAGRSFKGQIIETLQE